MEKKKKKIMSPVFRDGHDLETSYELADLCVEKYLYKGHARIAL